MLDIILKKEVYGTLIVILLSLIIFQLSRKIIKNVLTKDKNNAKRRLMIIKLFQNILKYILIIICALIILDLFNFDIKTILAGLGIVGLIIGLALQDTIKDFLGGLAIILDDYYAIGDWISYKDFKGEVIGFGLRSTKIKNSNGDVMTFANRMITEIINYTRVASVLFLDIPTSYEEDFQKVEKALNKALKDIIKIDNVIKNNTTYLGINDLSNNGIIYRIQINCLPSTQFNVKREALKIIKEIYEKDDIKFHKISLEGNNGS